MPFEKALKQTEEVSGILVVLKYHLKGKIKEGVSFGLYKEAYE